MAEAARAKVSPVAWLAAPAGLFFVLFFLLPFGVMALLASLTGNPVQRPNVTFTARHYDRILDNSLYVEALASTLRIGAVTTAAALLIGYPLAHWMARMQSRARPRAAADGGDRADADRHRRAHLRLDDDPVRTRASSTRR